MIIKTVLTVLGVDITAYLDFDYEPKQEGGQWHEPIQESMSFKDIQSFFVDDKARKELNAAGLGYVRSERAGDELEKILSKE